MRQIALENPGFLDTRPKFPDFSGKKKRKKKTIFFNSLFSKLACLS